MCECVYAFYECQCDVVALANEHNTQSGSDIRHTIINIRVVAFKPQHDSASGKSSFVCVCSMLVKWSDTSAATAAPSLVWRPCFRLERRIGDDDDDC